MAVFLMWLVSVLNSPGAGMSLQNSSPSVVPLLTTGDCSDAGCGLNGTWITGLAGEAAGEAHAITLPSGEVVALR